MAVGIVLIGLGGPLLLAAVALVTRSGGGVRTGPEWRRVRVMWTAALVVGAAAAWIMHHQLSLGRGTMLIPAVIGLFGVVGVGLAETVVRPRAPTGTRSASLVPRRVIDYAPRGLATTVGGVAAGHLATLALTTASASADDMGRPGRAIAAVCGPLSSSAGPYPGSFYSMPLALLLGLTALAAAAALVAVARRPRGFAEDAAADDVLRRRSATRILAALGACIAGSHAGIALAAGTALLRLECQRGWMATAGLLLLASVAVAL